MPKWTKDQENAIFDRGGSLLVSAAAGSGKTAVLVERVIQKIIDKNNPVDADRLLVVTFTNAAAAEMRDRIFAKLSELSTNPEYEKLVEKQLVLLDKANISTIDSFCIRLARENFNLLGISPDFRITDENEMKILQASAMQETLAKYYSSGDPVFSQLCELLNSFRDDSALVNTILSIYGFMRSHPFCRDWLDEKLEQYRRGIEDVSKSVWANTLYPICVDALSVALSSLKSGLKEISTDPVLSNKLYVPFEEKIDEVTRAIKCCADRDLDGLYHIVSSVAFSNFPTFKNYEDPEKLEFIKLSRDLAKDVFASLQGLVCSDEAGFRADLIDLLPKIEKLFEMTACFTDILDKLKAEKNLADFADTEQFALSLLLEKCDGGYRRTALAERLAESFDEILIDECQDSNEAQDMIFCAVSKNEQNMFMVGDVKQSIYRFRQAMPELFIKKKDSFSPYNSTDYPASITLSKNFRSRKEVTSTVNFFFDQLMSRGMGSIDYTAERLDYGASYGNASDYDSELCLIELSTGEDRSVASAKYIAQRIKAALKTLKVTEKDGVRPARYDDFCILLRAPKDIAQTYIAVLEQEGVPACFQETPGLLQSIEISILVSLLRVVDNPTLDMDMLTVLYSDLFGFTTDDITKLRLIDRTAPLYRVLNLACESDDLPLREKSLRLVGLIDELRSVCAKTGVASLIDHIYRTLNLPEFFSVKYKNPSKAVNLSIFRGYAERLEKSELCSLSAFLRRVERIKEQGLDIKGSPVSQGGASAVQVMSIHHSKGLEFPFCFIADMSRKFNKRDLQNNTILHSSLGFACVRRDEQSHTEAQTVPLTASRAASEEAMLSEELRMLYVAMTRAREKLFLVITGKDPIAELEKCAQKVITPSSVISPYSVKGCRSYAQWVLMCASRHPALAGIFNRKFTKYMLPDTDCNFRIHSVKSSEELQDIGDIEAPPADSAEVDRITAAIKKNLSSGYLFGAEAGLPTKLSVSEISKHDSDPSLKVPSFDEQSLSAVQKGTAIHTFMQFADYSAAKEDCKKELERLVAQKFITEKQAEAIDEKKLERFFGSSVAQELFAAEEIRREYRFMLPVVAKELFPETDSDEEIMVQGIADCIVKRGEEYIILDYKSDAVNSMSVLKDRYGKQLSLYREAIAKLFETEAVRCIIYSFTLGDYIEV